MRKRRCSYFSRRTTHGLRSVLSPLLLLFILSSSCSSFLSLFHQQYKLLTLSLLLVLAPSLSFSCTSPSSVPPLFPSLLSSSSILLPLPVSLLIPLTANNNKSVLELVQQLSSAVVYTDAGNFDTNKKLWYVVRD